jgi:biopolymer transport protein ExbD
MIHVEPRRERVELNMAPMIDMVFLLIIFFLTATTFSEREREQDVLLPANRNPGSLSRDLDQHLIVNVVRDGSVRVYGETLSADALTLLVRDRRERSRLPLKVQVRADQRTAYGNVARALESIERAGVARPYIVTKMVDLEF